MNKIQIILCEIASKMPSSFVQNLIARLGSRSPVLFVKVQHICGKVAALSGAIITIEQLLPKSNITDSMSIIFGAITAIALGIGGGASLTTTNPNLASPDLKDNILNEKPVDVKAIDLDNMKRIKLVLDTLEEQLKLALTPEKKKEYLEDARSLAPKIVNGIWLQLANVAIDVLESTIKES